MINKVVLIHGIGGLEREPFFPHLKNFCESIGLNVFMPNLGNYRENIKYEDWAKYFDNNLLHILDKNTIVVAQSIGTQFSVKYLSNKNIELGLYISCAGPRQILNQRENAPERGRLEINPVAKLFKPTDNEFNNFKNLRFQKYSFFSDNDMWFEQSNLENYADEIGSIKILTPGKSHYNEHEIFEELENFIGEYIKRYS